jgi:hypothetical protein
LGDRVWNRSIREEIISALWLIAGLVAWQGGIKWLAWMLFVKAASDMMAAIVFAIIEVKIVRRSPNSNIGTKSPAQRQSSKPYPSWSQACGFIVNMSSGAAFGRKTGTFPASPRS